MALFTICMSSSVKCLFISFAHFLIELLCLFYCWILRGICVFQVQYLCPSYDLKIFPPVCTLSFHISNRFFSDQKLLVYQLINYQFIDLSIFPTYRSWFWCQAYKLFAKFYIAKIFYFVHFPVLQFYVLHSICDLFVLREIQLL